MKKMNVAFNVIGMVILTFCAVSIGVAQDNFSGVWVLDKGMTHNLPPGLQSYTMVEQQIVVGTKVAGNLGPSRGGGGAYDDSGSPGERGGGGGGGGGMRGGGGGGMARGGAAGGGVIGEGSPDGSIAIRMFIPQVAYPLDGKKQTSELAGLGKITVKARWTKDKKGLDLSMIRDVDFQGRPVTFSSDERWTLSDEGEVLKVQRSADTPGATDSIKLIFRKMKGEPATP